MNEIISKSNIIILALIYKYLTTGETKIKKWDVDKYHLYLSIEIHKNSHQERITYDELEIQRVYHLDEKYNYVLDNPCLLFSICQDYIHTIPQDIFLESLKEEYLKIIKVNRSKIKTKVHTEHKYECIEIYSMSASDAQESAKKILTKRENKNIKVDSAYYQGMKPDHLWSIPVYYDEDIIYLDIGKEDYNYSIRSWHYSRIKQLKNNI